MSATNDDTFFIRSIDGYAPCIGHLVSMLNYARWSLIPEVERLSQENLDYLLDERANTIGMLLEHIASVEEWYQEDTFGVGSSSTEPQRRIVGGNLGSLARSKIKGQHVPYYLERLQEVRQRTLGELAKRDDAWLFEVGQLGKREANNYFKWFHVVEEELGHTAQIRIIRKRFP